MNVDVEWKDELINFQCQTDVPGSSFWNVVV